jgi:hypothetical protein
MTAEPAAPGTALEQVLAETWLVMLDFDGPVTYLFIKGRNRIVANHMRQALAAGFDIPVGLRDTPDPDGTVTTVRPEAEWLEAGTTCSDTGLINFYAGESASRNFGPEPRRYEVGLELDGRRYQAEATTPAEVEERDGHAQVALTFDPPLPAFTG